VIKNGRQNIDIAREADPRKVLNCQSCCYGILLFYSFVMGLNHFSKKYAFSLSLCCSKIKRYLALYFYNILIKLQNAKLRLINPKRLKVFLLQK
jgi:hypothetical protein